MVKKTISLNHPRADFYVIYPFYIADGDAFWNSIGSAGIWEPKTNCSRQSLKNIVNTYLGEDDPIDFPIKRGLSYIGHIQNSSSPALKSFTGEIAFQNSKGEALFLEKDNKVRSFWPDFDLELHITPNMHSGVLVFHLATGECHLSAAVDINYHIQKCDDDQIPLLCSFRGGEWAPQDGRRTLKELFQAVLPKDIISVNDARFLMGSCVMVDTSSGIPSTKELDTVLTRLGMVKDWKYKLTELDVSRCLHLFNNIWAYSSLEGFATIAMTPDIEKETFLKDFHGRFPKSYLSVFLTTILADLTYKSALRNVDIVAGSTAEMDFIRETRVVLNLEPSHYTHLNRLFSRMKETWSFDQKYEVIVDSLNARARTIEAERLELEKKNRELAQKRENDRMEERKKREAAIALEKEIRDKRDRDINLLLGFIGIGQVVFAIIQLLGAENVAGWDVARSTALSWASVIFCALFFILILVVLIRAIPKRRNNTTYKEQ